MLEMPLTGQNDDDYFSPKISLKGGVTYKITTNVAVQGYPKGYDVVTLTQGTDKTNMTPLKQLNLINSGENIEENYFTPGADGDYYFHSTTHQTVVETLFNFIHLQLKNTQEPSRLKQKSILQILLEQILLKNGLL